MKKMMAFFVALAAALAAQTLSAGYTAEKFRNPPNIHSPAYFWMWNDRLDAGRLNAQLDDMFAHGMRSICVHPFPKAFRPGALDSEMEPDYLSEEYFAVFSNVVDHAAALGMNVWLYDEGGWPSGGACGQIAAADADGRFRHRLLGFGDGTQPFGLRDVPYGSGRANYPSIVERGTAEEFIRRTHEQYKRHVGHHFGKAIRFTFMDEPTIGMDFYGANLPWATDFDEVFRAKKGYDIRPFARRMLERKYEFDAETAARRIDFHDVLADLFVERFMDPVRRWDRANGLLSSGHLDGDDLPECATRYGYGSLMRSLRAMDVPGVDVIWRQLFPDTAGNIGRQVPFPRYAASVSHQKGAMLALTESFGIYGNSFTPDQMKWLVDYQMVRGINMFVFGYYSVSNARQWMLLFEPHSGPVAPWWDMEAPFFEYIARTSAILAEGRPAVDVAVHYDTRGFWAGGAETESAGALHYAAAAALDKMNCEYEFVDDDALAAATVEDGRLRVGAMSYSTFVLPSSKWMLPEARAKLDAFKAAGGRLLTMETLGEAPPACRIHGRCAPWLRVAKRENGGQTLYFFVNETQHEMWADLDIAEPGDIVQADPWSGDFIAVERGKNGVRQSFGPFGSALLIVGAKATRAASPKYGSPRVIDGNWTVRRISSYALGEDDFDIRPVDESPVATSPGDWRKLFGEHFSGKALYAARFSSDKSGRALLDLGTVGWTCRARLNGKDLPGKFFGPFRWEVDINEGENELEVVVANMLANAVTEPAMRAKVEAKYPPSPTYNPKQMGYDLESHQSGLIGPVTLSLAPDADGPCPPPPRTGRPRRS